MPVFYDQLGSVVQVPEYPQRIISIVPSQTELLFYLGLDAEIIGITRFCVHPHDKVLLKTKIGGTKQLNIELIKSLQPDLIIANKEENEQKQVEALVEFCPIWVSDIADLHGALDMITRIGEMVNRVKQATKLVQTITYSFNKLCGTKLNLRAAYLIWRKPYMAAGAGTFIDYMLQLCGLTNAFIQQRYPEITNEMLFEADPDVVMLSSEPYPFKEKHIAELKLILPRAKIILVDGEMFSWYGSRLLWAPEYFASVIQSII